MTCSVNSHSQDESLDLFEKNHFSVHFLNGVTSLKFDPLVGETAPIAATALTHHLQFQYQFNLSSAFGLTIKSGITVHPLLARVPPSDPFDGNLQQSYINTAGAIVLGDITAGISHNYMFGENKWFLQSNLATGISICPPYDLSYTVIEYAVQESRFEYNVNNIINPIISGSIGVKRSLKNLDLIGLSLYGQFYPRPLIEGVYDLYNNTSSGNLISRGNNYGINLSYTFTQGRKNKKLAALKMDNLSEVEIKKTYKKDKRFIDDKSKFFTLGFGVLSAHNEVADASGFYESAYYPSWSYFAKAKLGLSLGFFFESSINVEDYVQRFKRAMDPGRAGIEAFVATKFSFGLNKRITNPHTNFNFLNVFGGISVGVHNKKVNETYEAVSGISSGSYYYTQSTEINHVNRLMSTLYLGLEKDLRIGERFYLNFGYRFDEGLFTVSESTITYETNEFPERQAFGRTNGRAHSFFFGLTYHIPPKVKKG